MSIEQTISNYFDQLENYIGYIIPDWFINGTLRFIFSKTSMIVHSTWFAWEYFISGHTDHNTFTSVISVEAIYVGVLIGIQQLKHHIVMHGHVQPDGKIKATIKEVKKGSKS